MRLADVDFLRRPGRPVLGWLLLAVGLLAAAVSVQLDQRWRQLRTDAARQENALAAAHQAPSRPVVPLPATLAQGRWAQARVELGRPWAAALGAVEASTKEPVYLVAMVVDPKTGAIRLEGEADGFDQALAYVQALSAQPALSSATLESHSDTGAGSTRVRFKALALWRRM